MKSVVLMFIALLCFNAASALAGTSGTVAFNGNLVAPQANSQLTRVEERTVTGPDGNGVTKYVVYSVPTGEELAVFDTMQQVETFIAQLSEAAIYK